MPAVAQGADGVQHDLPQSRVYTGGDLVQQRDLRVLHQHPPHLQQPLLPAGQAAREVVGDVSELQPLQYGVRVGAGVVPVELHRSGPKVLPHSHVHEQRGIWKVRPRPARAILYAASPVMFLSNNVMVPLSGFRAPVSRLNSVLLPLPLAR